MAVINLKVSGQTAIAEINDKIVSGTVGLTVAIEYDYSWGGLHKTAYFKNGNQIRKRENISTVTTVPWEILRTHGNVLQIGVEGRSASGEVVIPTIWSSVSRIYEGAYGEIPAAPTPGEEEITPIPGGVSQLAVTVGYEGNTADFNAIQIREHIESGGAVVLYDPTTSRRMNFLGYDASEEGAYATFVNYAESPTVRVVYYVWDDARVSRETAALVTEELFQGAVGDIETVLDEIIEIQNGLIGGGGE